MNKISSNHPYWGILFISSQTIVVVALFLMLAGCSLGSSRQPIGESDDFVPREQYEELYERYQALAESLETTSYDDESMMNELSEVDSHISSGQELGGTVDAFTSRDSEASGSSRPVVHSGKIIHDYEGVDVEGAITRFRAALDLKNQGQFDRAMSEFRSLESSEIRQVRVRARFYTGEIFFQQGEYDLAMQVFERILQHDAFSGVVLKSLDRLITCSEQLNLASKRDQYSSLLNDFFES